MRVPEDRRVVVPEDRFYLADLTEKNAASNPISGFFRENFRLGDNRTKTRDWVRRVMAYDAVLGGR